MWNIPHLPNGHKAPSSKILYRLHLIVIASCRDKVLSLFLSSHCRGEKKKERESRNVREPFFKEMKNNQGDSEINK